MPLIKSKSKKAMSKNISEMMKSKTFAKGKPKKKKQQMAVAAAYSVKAKASKKSPKKPGDLFNKYAKA